MNEVRALIDQDRKKAGLLAVLTLGFIVILARSFGGGKAAAESAAAILPSGATAKTEKTDTADAPPMALGSPAVRAWIDGPLPPMTRNLFVLDLTRFRSVEQVAEEVDLDAINLEEQAVYDVGDDPRLMQSQLQASIHREADELRLEQIWFSADPDRSSVVINGSLLRIGQSIAAFRLIRVERNAAVIEKEGVEVVLEMQRN
ncbi:MAG: hypothetical protein AAF656_12910 [Planctomycetota bacterium]